MQSSNTKKQIRSFTKTDHCFDGGDGFVLLCLINSDNNIWLSELKGTSVPFKFQRTMTQSTLWTGVDINYRLIMFNRNINWCPALFRI